ncbi:MAG: SGNH/GDSL hydrolase family protein [Clostridia bacterium]|nr:SGNH/GDSL hydrolase family protein [Clostridia bacterium]
MQLIEKMAAKAQNNRAHEGVTIAFLGDSVTQGCFEIYKQENNAIEAVYDKQSSYERYLFDIFCTLYPSVPVNIINAGISGDNTAGGRARVERDVLRHAPDLCVVCYGLNDCSTAQGSVERYTENLAAIFDAIRATGCELIFMTPNMMNTRVSAALTDPDMIAIAERTAAMQNDGTFDAHIDAIRALCRDMQVPLCDCYAIWKTLQSAGVDTTALLSNHINHPTRQMNRLFADELVRVMLGL